MIPGRLSGAVLALAALLAPVAGAEAEDAWTSLVAAERAFAADSVARGMRAAFIDAFADGGLAYGPGPAPVREVWAKLPPQKEPLARLLEWAPEAAAAAASGDLGFTTGPFRMSERASGRLLSAGWFFSVWRRETGGSWKVLADMGVDAPPDAPPSLKVEAARPGPSTRGAAPCPVPADSGLRVHRDGRVPATGEAACALLAAEGHLLSTDAEVVSADGDLRYERGTWSAGAASAPARKGYFVRVWRRARDAKPQDAWLLAADVEKTAE